MSEFNINNPWYKYLRKEYALGMINDGALRIGTLRDFKKMEVHGNVVGDSDEGSRSLSFEGRGSLEHFQTMGVTFKNVEFDSGTSGIFNAIKQESPNAYLYCASYKYDETIMREFKADACVVIHNPELFFKSITTLFNDWGLSMAKQPVIGRCQYEVKNTVVSGYGNVRSEPIPVNIWLHKSPEYAYQAEVRALWNCALPNAEPRMIFCDGIKNACHLYGE